MSKFDNIEIYSFEDNVWYRNQDNQHVKLEETDREFISHLINRIKEFYPKAYAKLTEVYSKCASNIVYHQYKMVWRFCKCNFGNIDNVNDY